MRDKATFSASVISHMLRGGNEDVLYPSFQPQDPIFKWRFLSIQKWILLLFQKYCNQNLRYKNRALVTGGSTCNGLIYVWLLGQISTNSTYKQKPAKYSWIRSSRDRLGFYADINILFLVHFVYDTLFCFEKTSLYFSSIKSKTIVVLLFRATNL